MLPAFLARVKPVYTMATPACIQNTSAAPIKNHTLNTSLILMTPLKIEAYAALAAYAFVCFLVYVLGNYTRNMRSP